MPTSDKRREIAAMLRGNANKHGVVLDYLGSTQVASWLLLLHTIGCNSNEQEVAFNMLADLIDPMCHLLPSSDGGFGCDRCYTWFPSMKEKTNYCPHCGARIVYNENVN